MADRLHYTACDLDEIYLLNGFDIVETGYGPGPVIKNPKQLYNAVAASVLGRIRLNGQAGRYLQKWLALDDAELATLLALPPGQIAVWEREPERIIPAAAAARLRQAALKGLPAAFKPVSRNTDGPSHFRFDNGRWHSDQANR